ncbi:MAG: SRPBCC family protein [Solimonas sp.]
MSQSFSQAVSIHAPAGVVWACLTRVERMRAWMAEPEMVLEIAADWRVGGVIVMRGFHHERFENTGTVLAFEPQRLLRYTQLNSLSRLPDVPENHALLEFRLAAAGDAADDATALTFTASRFATPEIYKHLQFYWAGTLGILKRQAEGMV